MSYLYELLPEILPELCALFVAIATTISSPDKTAGYSMHEWRMEMYKRILLIDLTLSILSIIISGELSYAFFISHLVLYGLLCFLVAIYMVSVCPRATKYYKTYYSICMWAIMIYSGLVLISIGTGWVYRIGLVHAQKGPLWELPYFYGMALGVAVLSLIGMENFSKHAIITIGEIVLSIALPALIGGIIEIRLTGIGATAALIMILNSFHKGGRFSLTSGTESPALFEITLNKLKKKPFSLLLYSFDRKGLEAQVGIETATLITKEVSTCFHKEFTSSSIYDMGKYFVLTMKSENEKEAERITKTIIAKYEGKLRNFYTCYIQKENVPARNSLPFVKLNEIWHVFDEHDKKTADEDCEIYNTAKQICIDKKLDDDRVMMYAQPIYNRKTKKYLTAEILCRLNLPKLGIISPGRFIPIIESEGYIHNFNQIMLNKACHFINELKENQIEFDSVSVNFSPNEILIPTFIDDISAILNKTGVTPPAIHIEITEATSSDDMALLKKRVSTLKEMGFEIYLDDFGTGYSNIAELFRIPFDVIKFDKSLIDEALEKPRSRKMLYELTHTFAKEGYHILYEGVENAEGKSISIANKVDYVQGFAYSKPVPSDEFINFLKSEGQAASDKTTKVKTNSKTKRKNNASHRYEKEKVNDKMERAGHARPERKKKNDNRRRK